MAISTQRSRHPRGRRPGRSNAREDILRAAVQHFGNHGLAGATLRGIAGDAGADPALIRHYFGSKTGLFKASVGSVLNPIDDLDLARPTDPSVLSERIARHFLRLVGRSHPVRCHRPSRGRAAAGARGR